MTGNFFESNLTLHKIFLNCKSPNASAITKYYLYIKKKKKKI